jgi:hypothetical protein
LHNFKIALKVHMALYNTPCRSYREFAEGYLVLPKSQRSRLKIQYSRVVYGRPQRF